MEASRGRQRCTGVELERMVSRTNVPETSISTNAHELKYMSAEELQ